MSERERRADAIALGRAILGTPGVWGGDFGLTRPGADCSGWIVHGIWQPLELAPPHPWDAWSVWLWRKLARVPEGEDPLPGDLAFYGWPIVSHVMMVSGPRYPIPGEGGVSHLDFPVMGVSGARPTIRTVAKAIKKGARAREFDSHLYRWDFRGFRRGPFDGRLVRSVA